MNIIILFSYHKVEGTWDGNTDNPSLFDSVSVETTKAIIYIIGAFMSTFFGIMLISFFYKRILSNYYRMNIKYSKKKGKSHYKPSKCMFVCELMVNIIFNWGAFYSLASFILAICGCAIHPMFFAYHIFVAAFRSEKLQSVLKDRKSVV